MVLTLAIFGLGLYAHFHIWDFGGQEYVCNGAPAHGFTGDLEACYRNIMIVWRARDILFVLSGVFFVLTPLAAIWRRRILDTAGIDVDGDGGVDDVGGSE
jgi:hypothetical protein